MYSQYLNCIDHFWFIIYFLLHFVILRVLHLKKILKLDVGSYLPVTEISFAGRCCKPSVALKQAKSSMWRKKVIGAKALKMGCPWYIYHEQSFIYGTFLRTGKSNFYSNLKHCWSCSSNNLMFYYVCFLNLSQLLRRKVNIGKFRNRLSAWGI